MPSVSRQPHADKDRESASKILEYACDDWSVSRLAKAVGANCVFGSLLLEQADIDIGSGKPHIRSVTRNGKPWTKSWTSHAELMQGRMLEFTMGAAPDKRFGRAPQDRPPWFGAAAAQVAARTAGGYRIPCRAVRRQVAGGTPKWRLNARWNAALES